MQEMIEEIKQVAECRKVNNKQIYIIKKDRDIPVLVQIIGREYCQFKDFARNTIGWEFTTVDRFYEKYVKHINDYLVFVEVSKRRWGEPKLEKPKELKNIAHVFSIQCIGRKNQIFIKGNDVWIKDNDYFSECISQEEARERGLEITARQRFNYNDNWAMVVLRGEGWLCIKNLLLYIEDHNIRERLYNKICNYYNWNMLDLTGDLERFYSDVLDKLRKLKQNENK